jgi:hypothetical protein
MIADRIKSQMPWLILVAFGCCAAFLLMLPLWMPIGPNYWDIYTYVDAAHRISTGQLPNVDFFVPVGPLGYYFYVALSKLFPQGHTVLQVQYAILPIALPVMILIARDAARRSAGEALALVVPFVIFAAFPMNTLELFPSPGFDAFGNYNRHGALLLYVMVAAILFSGSRQLASVLCVVLLVALFLTKITAFLVGLGLLIHATLAGRLHLRAFLLAAGVAAAGFGALDLSTGLIRHYVADVIELVGMNTGFLLPRFMTVLSTKLDVVAPAGLLALLLFWRMRTQVLSWLKPLDMKALQSVIDTPAVWLVSTLLGSFVYETQNTGSHEFIMIWLTIILAMRDYRLPWTIHAVPVIALVAAIAIPTPGKVLHRSARAIVSAMKYERLNVPEMGPVGRVLVKPEILLQARAMLPHYAESRASYERIAKRGVLPSYILFSEPDFQVNWLMSSNEAVAGVRAYETRRGKPFERIVMLDFVDPLPVALKRQPLRDLSIGNDPDRTLAKLGTHVIEDVRQSDAILVPLCPVTTARQAIFDAYVKQLDGRRLVTLSPCFKMYVRD